MLTVMISLSDHFSLLVLNLSGLWTTSVKLPTPTTWSMTRMIKDLILQVFTFPLYLEAITISVKGLINIGNYIHISDQVSDQIADLFSGLKISDCLLPCVRTVATVQEGTTTKWDGQLIFSLMFNHEVKVKKTSVDKFSFMDSLNFFGSNLGLWPGLGLYQIMEGMVGIFLVSHCLKKISSLMDA